MIFDILFLIVGKSFGIRRSLQKFGQKIIEMYFS